jgi:tRNA 2-selenouridine synthase
MHSAIKTVDEIQVKKQLIIDVRSPSEYEEYHVPNAVNIPIFSDEERAQVGRTYKRVSQEAAKELGLKIFSPKLPLIYEEVKNLLTETNKEEILVYCWRGGMRSRSVVAMMNLLELPCVQLQGGIRAYRKMTSEKLEDFRDLEQPFVVLHGYTGSRKTDLLQQLKAEGYPVIDLEDLAGHRGSIFGQIGLQPRSQKTFEMLLVRELERLKGAPYIIIEGESKRIGKVVIPDFILEGKEVGRKLFISYPFEKRVETIYRTYHPDQYLKQLSEAMDHLEKRLDPALLERIETAKQTGNNKQICALLIEQYYDKKYQHQMRNIIDECEIINMPTFAEGVHQLKAYLSKLTSEVFTAEKG